MPLLVPFKHGLCSASRGGSLGVWVVSPPVGVPPELASPTAEAQVRSVKLALRTQGYPRQALAQLPDDGSQGGRELLLALAWLLARGPLPERLLTQNRVQLGDEMPVCECEALASPGPPAPSVEADGCVDIRHLQWLMGKLRFRWRNLMASQQEQCALLGKNSLEASDPMSLSTKVGPGEPLLPEREMARKAPHSHRILGVGSRVIHSYTRGCHSDRSLGHLSVTETELLRDPEGGRQVRAGGTKVGVAQGDTCNLRASLALGAASAAVCVHVAGYTSGCGKNTGVCAGLAASEGPLELRKTLLKGPSCRYVFPSHRPPSQLLGRPRLLRGLAFRKPGLGALASRPTGDTVLGACPPEASQPTFLPRIPTPGAGALEPLVRELQALQGELREAVEARRAAWEAEVGGHGPEWSTVRTALREAVGQDLAALRQACERGGGCSLAQPHGPHRLVRTEAGAPGGPGLRAPEVIEALRSREAHLEVVLRQLQGQCRQELARLVGAPPGPVWILPPGR
ncbi:hypothetical protein BU61_4338 [Pontoporia blainvillei]|uniref:Tubulin epsilon and delta complex protein 1 domain-containing protein n=1 Tax=Pontoporia blainvillei TaxID=48723 RepID=A0ABX0S651_PONBL|nr:hypothetical protein [Pontoporia blainvillei]